MKISVVSFDLTGTLLKPFPSIGELCVEAMREQGIAEIPDAKEFNARRDTARRVAQVNGNSPTSERRSRDYWRAMLWEIFAGHCNNRQFELAAEYIYHALASPEHWKLMPEVVRALEAISFLGVKMVVLSNGDSRWKKALADKQIAHFFDRIFVSSETGFAKPGQEAFDNLCREMSIPRGELLHIGDTLAEDIIPAVEFGANALWVTSRPTALPPDNVLIFSSMRDVPEYLRSRMVAPFSKKKLTRSANNLLAGLSGLPQENLSPRKYAELDREKETKLSRRFVEDSEVRREQGRTEPQDVASLWEGLLRSHGYYEQSLQTQLMNEWNDLLPAKLADRTTPVALENNFSVLKVQCANTVVRQEFEFRKSAILKKIHARIAAARKIRRIVLI